ncbi:MAG: hypothetical protein QM817_04755 [Archangium sp.]
MDDLRRKLDTASLTPRGRWKELWLAAADEFCAPAKPYVERALGDASSDGQANVTAFLETFEGEIPLASRGAWKAALEPWVALERKERGALKPRVKSLLAAVTKASAPELVVPIYLAALEQDWPVRLAFERGRWHQAHPLAASILVNCIRLPYGHDDVSDNAFFSLGRVNELPSEARGAMWLVLWGDRSRIAYRWGTMARLREPAAIAAGLAESLHGLETWEPRPALTRALMRIIVGEDPWLAVRRESDYPEAPTNADVISRAVAMLPRIAQATGLEDEAREVLATRWASFGVTGALARGFLGCADAVPALIDALGGERASDALLALSTLGLDAKAALERVSAAPESLERTIALASIDPSPATLDALIPIVERRAERAADVREQYQEGLITSDEYARWFDPADFAARSWRNHGFTPERAAALRRLAAALADHEAIHGDAAIQRLRDVPPT